MEHPKEDMINHPPHYTHGKIEPIDVIADWELGFCLGNTLKYIARADHKGTRLQDLQKAAWYLAREILDWEKAEKKTPPDEESRYQLSRIHEAVVQSTPEVVFEGCKCDFCLSQIK